MGHEQEAALSSAERQANQLKLQQQQGCIWTMILNKKSSLQKSSMIHSYEVQRHAEQSGAWLKGCTHVIKPWKQARE